MARKTIWIPDDVFERMERVKSMDINWSQIATTAFQVKLAEVERKGQRTMEQFAVDMFIAERLFGWHFPRTHMTRHRGTDIEFIDKCTDSKDIPRNVSEVPRYSSSFEAARGAIRAAEKTGIYVVPQKPVTGNEVLVRGFHKDQRRMVWATAEREEQVPEAVCKVLYRLLTGE